MPDPDGSGGDVMIIICAFIFVFWLLMMGLLSDGGSKVADGCVDGVDSGGE